MLRVINFNETVKLTPLTEIRSIAFIGYGGYRLTLAAADGRELVISVPAGAMRSYGALKLALFRRGVCLQIERFQRGPRGLWRPFVRDLLDAYLDRCCAARGMA